MVMGRPKGSTTKPQFRDFVTIEEARAWVDDLKGQIKNKDYKLLVFAIEQYFGKALQAQEITGKDGKDLFEPSERIKALAKELNELHRKK